MDPHDLSRSFDSRVRATDREISRNDHPGLKSARSSAVMWLVAAVLIALALGAAIGAFVLLRG